MPRSSVGSRVRCGSLSRPGVQRGSIVVRAPLVLLALSVLLVGCTSVSGAPSGARLGRRSGDQGDRQAAVTPTPAPSANASTTAGPPLSADDLGQLYQLVIETYVDRVDHSLLIDGAIAGIHRGAVARGLLPLEAAVVETTPLRISRDPERDWLQFERAYDAFTTKLLRRVPVGDVGEAAAQGMLAALGDPQTRYVDRSTVEAQERRSYAGIGVSLTLQGDRGPPIVREVFTGSPAEAAGVRVGDTILAVDDRPTDNMSLADSVQAIRGVEGTVVSLQVRAPTDSRAATVRVPRATMELPLVQTERKDDIQYIRVRSFQEGVSDLVRSSLNEAARNGAGGVILDLRGNSGGNLQEVTNTAALFLGDAMIGIRVGRAQERAAIRGMGRPVAPQLPLIVLVDRDTGSGAEVLAAALRDRDVARLLGTRTAGRAGVASVVPLANGAVAQITTQRMLSSTGERLDGVGVEPDVVIEAGVNDWIQGRDPQLDRALVELRS